MQCMTRACCVGCTPVQNTGVLLDIQCQLAAATAAAATQVGEDKEVSMTSGWSTFCLRPIQFLLALFFAAGVAAFTEFLAVGCGGGGGRASSPCVAQHRMSDCAVITDSHTESNLVVLRLCVINLMIPPGES